MHIELIGYASPQRHAEFIKEVNKWRYPVDGGPRHGTHAPFVSEWRVYDIRIKEEVAPRFIRDIQPYFADYKLIDGKYGKRKVDSEKKLQGLNIIKYAITIFRFFARMGTVVCAKGKKEYYSPKGSWLRFHLIGTKPDPKQNNKLGEKEVL